MELKELIEIVHGKSLNNYKKVKIRDFKTDTRKLKNNDVFIALTGKTDNGNNHINDKIKASVVITDMNIKLKNIPVIKVDNTYDTLFYLGNYFRCKYNIPVINITGSNGKTTSKELIYNILSTKYNVLKNEGNENNIIGVFNTLKKLNDKHDIAVIELGMNHLKEMSRLSKMCLPNKAIITNIGSAHIGYLKSKKNIFKAKLEIKDGLQGELIVNGDDKYLKHVKAYKCGTKTNNDLIAYNIYKYNNHISFNICIDKEYQVVFNIPSTRYIPTLLEAIKIGIDYNIDIKDIINKIKEFKPVEKRLNIINKDDYIIIDDSYNASYESVKFGLDILNQYDKDKIIILGDMLELGNKSIKYHKKINKLLNKIDNKLVFTIGNYTKYIYSNHFDNINDLIENLDNINLSNKCIYIKGSRKMNLDKVVDYLNK